MTTGLLVLILELAAGVILMAIRADSIQKLYNQLSRSVNALLKENSRVHDLWLSADVDRTRIARKLLIAKGALNDIANQCAGDPCYEIWARKRAVDTVNLIEKPERK